ncbi:hypothetical protein ABK040_010369 [Willaertia magna]
MTLHLTACSAGSKDIINTMNSLDSSGCSTTTEKESNPIISSYQNSNQTGLPPVVQFVTDKFWYSSRMFKISLLIGVVIIQMLFYHFYLKHTLTNPSIQYKRKRFFDHHLGFDSPLSVQENVIKEEKPSHYLIIGYESENKDYETAHCIAYYLRSKSPLISFETKLHPNQQAFNKYIKQLKEKNISNWFINKLWNRNKNDGQLDNFNTPYILLVKNNKNYQEIGVNTYLKLMMIY